MPTLKCIGERDEERFVFRHGRIGVMAGFRLRPRDWGLDMSTRIRHQWHLSRPRDRRSTLWRVSSPAIAVGAAGRTLSAGVVVTALR